MRYIFFILFFITSLLANHNNDFISKYLNDEQKAFLKEHKVFRVSNEYDWPPYDYNESGEPKGYAIDYLKMLSRKLGVDFVFVTDKWVTLDNKIKNKELDLIHPLSINEKRKKYLNFTNPFIQNQHTIVVNNSNKNIRTLEDLKDKTIAVAKGWNTTRYLKEAFPNAKFVEVTSSKQMLEAVAFGEADATIEGFLTVNYLKQRYLLSNIKVASRVSFPTINGNLHIGVRKDWPILRDILNIAIKNVTDDEIIQLNKKWVDVKASKIILTRKEIEFLKNNPLIKVRASEKYFPFSFTENGAEKGYVIDYTNLLAKKLDIEFEYIKNQSWGEAIEDFKNGRLDVLPMMKETEERKEYATFTFPIIETYVGIATLKNRIKTTNLNTLVNKKVAVMEGYWFLDNLKKYYPNIKIKVYKNNLECLIALKEGDVDAVISTEPVLQYLIKKNFFTNLWVKPILNNPHFEKTISRYAIRKDWEIFKKILEKAMASLTEEEVSELKTRWFSTSDTKKKTDSLVLTKDEKSYLEKTPRIRMCVDPDRYPYEQIKDGKYTGISSDYFKIFQKYIPSKIELIKTDSWAQSLEFIKNRQCDILSLAVETPERKAYLDFTTPYISFPLVVVTKSGKPFVADISNILEQKFAIVTGYFHIELLKRKYPKIKIVEVASVKDGFDKVESGEVYGYITSLIVAGNKIQTQYLGNLKIAGKLEENFSMGVAVRNDTPELFSIFEKVIMKIKDGDRQAILNKWVSITYERAVDYAFLFQAIGIIVIVLLLFIYRQYLLKKQNMKLLKTQMKLEESVGEFESLINSTLEAIFIFEDKKCIKANEEAIKLFKYESEDELKGINLFDIISKKFHAKVEKNLGEDSINAYEAIGVKKDKIAFPILVRSEDFVFRSKLVRLVVVMDLTELKHKERLLTEQTKMVALGEMIGNIAHQWRQPLSVISTAASGIKLQKEIGMLDDTLFEESMDGIVNNAKYLSKTIDDFRNFVSENKAKIEFDLHEHIEKDLSILKPMLRLNNIEIITNYQKDIRVLGIPNELSQVIINIITNAKDKFLEEGLNPRFLFIETFTNQDKKYIIIKDNALGIKDEIIDKIFEPYFTTKHKNQGTGLGLYMTNQIVSQSFKGNIEVENVEYTYNNRDEKGAKFTICLNSN